MLNCFLYSLKTIEMWSLQTSSWTVSTSSSSPSQSPPFLVNGGAASTCLSTSETHDPWIHIDLNYIYVIAEITIDHLNQEDMDDLQILVGLTPDIEGQVHCATSVGSKGEHKTAIPCQRESIGQYLTIQKTGLALINNICNVWIKGHRRFLGQEQPNLSTKVGVIQRIVHRSRQSSATCH